MRRRRLPFVPRRILADRGGVVAVVLSAACMIVVAAVAMPGGLS